MSRQPLRQVGRGTVLGAVLLLCLTLGAVMHAVGEERGTEGAELPVELRVLINGKASSPIPVLTEGGPPEPPITWNRVDAVEPDGDSWILHVRIIPADARRLVTVRIIGDVDPFGVPLAEPVSFTCGDDSPPGGMSCTANGGGRYTATWPRSLGARVAISSDLAVGGEIRYTTWAISLPTSEDVTG